MKYITIFEIMLHEVEIWRINVFGIVSITHLRKLTLNEIKSKVE